ncbi:hypothetical protein EGR_07796 [Echinococcus granulosus]|uniref:Uncharacterized protein n=1 Tax=Echinococcus granulosus TaxID=6210 RepID=W6UGT5_ECHGR|nr:hypothetical protein EGR_07796 [Echinococcus granulosus]EUB57337.1 hypothetical protein EGR_07796 [Echinococcus granulosus]
MGAEMLLYFLGEERPQDEHLRLMLLSDRGTGGTCRKGSCIYPFNNAFCVNYLIVKDNGTNLIFLCFIVAVSLAVRVYDASNQWKLQRHCLCHIGDLACLKAFEIVDCERMKLLLMFSGLTFETRLEKDFFN